MFEAYLKDSIIMSDDDREALKWSLLNFKRIKFISFFIEQKHFWSFVEDNFCELLMNNKKNFLEKTDMQASVYNKKKKLERKII